MKRKVVVKLNIYCTGQQCRQWTHAARLKLHKKMIWQQGVWKMKHMHTGANLDHWLFFLLQSSSSKTQQENRGWWSLVFQCCSVNRETLESPGQWIRVFKSNYTDKDIHQIRGERAPFSNFDKQETMCRSRLDLNRTLCRRNESSDWGIVRCSNILTSPPLKMNQVWFQTIWSSWKLLISSPPFSCWASCLLSWDARHE